MLDNYEPSMESPDDADGGRCLDWEEAEPLLEQLEREIDLTYQQKDLQEGEWNPLIYEANGAWVFYNHAEPELPEVTHKLDEDLRQNIYNCIRKAFIDGYIVGFKLRVSGQRYVPGD